MIEQLHTINVIIRDSFLAQPLMSIVALIITGFLLVLEYFLLATDKPGYVDKKFLAESDKWLEEIRFKHLGSTFKPSSRQGAVPAAPMATDPT
jgi:hypothetical protein